MAVVNPTYTEGQGGTHRYVWSGIANGDTCTQVSLPGAPDVSIQVYGTFGGATLAIQGSLDAVLATATFAPLQDPQGNALSFTAAGIDMLASSIVTWLKPVLSGGAGTTLTVVMLAKGMR